MEDADVIIVGAGPVGLMLAGELGLAGVRPLVLERQPENQGHCRRPAVSAGGLLELLRYRGELERFEAASPAPLPAFRPGGGFPWGGMRVGLLPTRRSPDEGAATLTTAPRTRPRRTRPRARREIRRGHPVGRLSQDGATVTAEVRGPDGQDRVTARSSSAATGGSGRVRDMAGIAFPGVTYPEVQRLAQVTFPESVTLLENGDIDVAGVGGDNFGFARDPNAASSLWDRPTQSSWAFTPARRSPPSTTTTSRSP